MTALDDGFVVRRECSNSHHRCRCHRDGFGFSTPSSQPALPLHVSVCPWLALCCRSRRFAIVPCGCQCRMRASSKTREFDFASQCFDRKQLLKENPYGLLRPNKRQHQSQRTTIIKTSNQ